MLNLQTVAPSAAADYCSSVTFGERVKQARNARGWSRERLAKESGVSERTIAYVEAGERGPNLTTARQLADTLGITDALPGGSSVTAPPSASLPAISPFPVTPDVSRDVQHRVTVGDLMIVEPVAQERGMPVMGTASAGSGGIGEPTGEIVMIPEFLLTEQSYILQARGDSMIDEGVSDGDYLLVQRQGIAAHGELCIAWLNDSLVVKRWYRRNGRKFLESANPAMGWHPREITATDVFEIQGVVRHIVKRTKRIS